MKSTLHPTPSLYLDSGSHAFRFLALILLLMMLAPSNGNAQLAYNIDDVDGETLYLPGSDGTITIYDSGGPFGSYSNFEDYEVTICSDVQLAGCPPPAPINIFFIQFDIEAEPICNYDGLQVDGGEAFCNDNYPPWWGSTVPSVIENESGCITLRFYSDLSVVKPGFEVVFAADYIPETGVITCGDLVEDYVDLAIEGCFTCYNYHECGGDQYGPYYASEDKYTIEGEGLMTLTVTGDVDFFVYGYTTNIGPNGCPPLSSIVCAAGSQSTATFNADDYPYGIYIIIDGMYDEPYTLNLQCGYSCNPCDECFGFIPRYLSNNIVDFKNQYCEVGIPTLQDPSVTQRGSALTFDWSVPNANEQYTSGTSSASENPSIIFPGAGSYTVCQKVYSFGILVFECCHTVFIGPCSTPPVAYYSSTLGAFDRFVLNADANGNHVQWTFSDPDVFFFQGNENSTNPVIVIPYGTCVTVCVYETNSCGTSSYCTELCLGHPTCGGSTPPVYITNDIEPVIEDKTVEISLPTPPGGGQAIYSWDFGDGSFSTNKNISHTFDEYGNYTVCVVITVGCRTWCYCWCIPLNPCEPVYTYNEGDLEVEFIGTENVLQYTFTSSTPKAPGESWLVNGNPVSGTNTSLTYTFPTSGNYTICFPYLGPDNCIYYYCIDVYAGNPFLCNSITWQFAAATGYRFTIPSGSSDIQWTIDETGQTIGQNATSNWVLPVTPCGWRTISVRYFDGVRYRICCLRIYLCPPDECFGSIDYGYLSTTDQATFKLNTTGNTDISWYFDDDPGQILGTGVSIAIPYPGTCISRWISARYKDSSGRWRICCRLIYFCNPITCNIIKVNYNENLGYSFTAQQSEQNMSWIVEETGTSLGTNQTSNYLAVGPNCGYRTISLRYWIPGLGWKLCCIRFYWCDPASCSDNITFITSGATLGLQAPDYLQELSWYKDATLLGAGNPQATALSLNGTHKICLRYFDPCDDTWKWCCRTYTPGGPSGSLTFDFDNNICGEQNQVVEVPLRVRGFNNIINFQFSVQLEDTTKGRLIEIVPQNISGDFGSFINNAGTGSVYWENASEVDLPDNTIIALARVRIVSATAGEVKVSITGSPNPVYAEDGAGNAITPVLRDGSFCYEFLVNVCGKITREDLVPISNVTVSLNGCKRYLTVTDANGNYCFIDVPAGTTYEVRASKDVNYKNGVNTGDLSAIKRHILGSVKLNTPYKIVAGDAKKSNGVNTGDISELRRLIQGVYTDLPTCESWEFTDRDYVFPTPANPFLSEWSKSVVLQNIQQDITDADMIGWKMGDVNLSNNPQNVDGTDDIENRSLTDLYLSLSSVSVPGQDTFLVDVTTKQFNQILNGSFSIHFDPAKLTLHGITGQHPALNLSDEEVVINGAAGNMVFVWESGSGVTVADESVLFSLKFTPKVSQLDLSEVSFSGDPTEIYFENEVGEILNVITSNGEVSVPVRELRRAELVIHPNPAREELNIRVLFERPVTVGVELINELGVVVRQLPKNLVASTVYTDRLDLSHLPAGVYLVRILTEEGEMTRRIIHL